MGRYSKWAADVKRVTIRILPEDWEYVVKKAYAEHGGTIQEYVHGLIIADRKKAEKTKYGQ